MQDGSEQVFLSWQRNSSTGFFFKEHQPAQFHNKGLSYVQLNNPSHYVMELQEKEEQKENNLGKLIRTSQQR